jgi:hypothetical protein
MKTMKVVFNDTIQIYSRENEIMTVPITKIYSLSLPIL